MNEMIDGIIARIEKRDFKIGVVGLGYVGLPLTIEFANAGFNVTGFDVDPEKIDTLTSSRSYIKHIPSAKIAEMNGSGRFHATSDFALV